MRIQSRRSLQIGTPFKIGSKSGVKVNGTVKVGFKQADVLKRASESKADNL